MSARTAASPGSTEINFPSDLVTASKHSQKLFLGGVLVPVLHKARALPLGPAGSHDFGRGRGEELAVDGDQFKPIRSLGIVEKVNGLSVRRNAKNLNGD